MGMKRRTIFICAGAVLLVGAGLAAYKHYFSSPPAVCSFPSTISTSIPEVIPIHANEGSTSTSLPSTQLLGTKPLITDEDRVLLEDCLQSEEKGNWYEMVTIVNNPTLEYRLLRRDPKNKGPKQYLSVIRYITINNPTQVKNFMTDNDYKLQADSTVVSLRTLEVDKSTGIEVWHAIKKYPVIGNREYVLATKIWEREKDQSYFCVTKACTHPKAPNPTHTLITHYLSGWKISKAAKGGCEVKVFHQEDFKSAMADKFKDLFTSSIRDYVLKTAESLQQYILQNRQPKEGINAATLAQKL